MCPRRPDACGRLAAAYSIESGNILFDHSLDARRQLHRSYIVHELVHSLQHRAMGARLNASCLAILNSEREAYAVQARYLQWHGVGLPVGLELRARRCPPEQDTMRR